MSHLRQLLGSQRCSHRSHRLRLPCLRESTYDHLCGKHNDTCFHGCKENQ